MPWRCLDQMNASKLSSCLLESHEFGRRIVSSLALEPEDFDGPSGRASNQEVVRAHLGIRRLADCTGTKRPRRDRDVRVDGLDSSPDRLTMAEKPICRLEPERDA